MTGPTVALAFVFLSCGIVALWLGPDTMRAQLRRMLRCLWKWLCRAVLLALILAAAVGVIYGVVRVVRFAWGDP